MRSAKIIKPALYLCCVKIAVNTRLLLRGRLEGIGQFTSEIFRRLVTEHPEHEWYFIFDRPFSEEFRFSEQLKIKVLFPPTRHPVLWHWWFQASLPLYLWREKIDLFISPDGMIPLWGKTTHLPVIHDLNYKHQPKNLDIIAGSYMRYFYPKFAHRAKRVATVSNFCREDIAQTYQLPHEKIDVVPNAYRKHFKALNPTQKEEVRGKYNNGKPYFLYLGALNPRKNLEGLLNAFALYRDDGGDKELLIVGERMRWTRDIEEAFRSNPHQAAITFTGRLEDQDLAQVLAAAEALCLVSHFEGFGIPILEAYACQTPVICANNTAMPEVAGEGALLVDSRDIQSIKKALQKIDDEQVKAELIAKGQEQKQKYSWERSSEAMWRSIQNCFPHGLS